MTEETEEITCIMCPRGCNVRVTTEDGEVKEVKGNACEQGEEFAVEEVKSPSRTVMSVIGCEGGKMPTVSVKTSKPVPKGKMNDVMEAISGAKVNCPVEIGDKIIENVAGTEADIVATRPA